MKLAVITPINSTGGIAEHSYDTFSKLGSGIEVTYIANRDIDRLTRLDENVVRIWEWGTESLEDVTSYIIDRDFDVVHIQYHPAFFKLEALVELIRKLSGKTKIFLSPHIVQAPHVDLATISEELNMLDGILVHRHSDLIHLRKNNVHNIQLTPLPIPEYALLDKNTLKQKLGISRSIPIIISHGLASSHKGLFEVADAIKILKQKFPNILWLAQNPINPNDITSSQTISELEQRIQALGIEDNVRIFKSFLTEKQVNTLIQASDIGVLPYKDVGESASAAVRKFLGAGTVVITTDIPMLKEFSDCTYQIQSQQPELIAGAVTELVGNIKLRNKLITTAQNKAHEFSFSNLAKMLKQIYSS